MLYRIDPPDRLLRNDGERVAYAVLCLIFHSRYLFSTGAWITNCIPCRSESPRKHQSLTSIPTDSYHPSVTPRSLRAWWTMYTSVWRTPSGPGSGGRHWLEEASQRLCALDGCSLRSGRPSRRRSNTRTTVTSLLYITYPYNDRKLKRLKWPLR